MYFVHDLFEYIILTEYAQMRLGIVNIINICVIYYVTSTWLKVLLGIYLIDWKSVMPNKYLWNWSYLFGLNPSRSIYTYFIPPTWSLINNSRVFDEKNYYVPSLKTRVQIITYTEKKTIRKKLGSSVPFSLNDNYYILSKFNFLLTYPTAFEFFL